MSKSTIIMQMLTNVQLLMLLNSKSNVTKVKHLDSSMMNRSTEAYI